jgi:hypothetical protein
LIPARPKALRFDLIIQGSAFALPTRSGNVGLLRRSRPDASVCLIAGFVGFSQRTLPQYPAISLEVLSCFDGLS